MIVLFFISGSKAATPEKEIGNGRREGGRKGRGEGGGGGGGEPFDSADPPLRACVSIAYSPYCRSPFLMGEGRKPSKLRRRARAFVLCFVRVGGASVLPSLIFSFSYVRSLSLYIPFFSCPVHKRTAVCMWCMRAA